MAMLTTLASAATSAPPVDDFGLSQVAALVLMPVLAVVAAVWGGWIIMRDDAAKNS